MLMQKTATAPVKLVVAPEGYRKTEVVHDAVRGVDCPVVHFFFPDEGGSLHDAVHAFVLALAPVAPGLVSSFAGAAEYARNAAEPQEELALWTVRHLKGARACIVVHDVDAGADAAFADFLRRVIEGCDSATTWICVARSMPPLPWESWKAFGLVETIVTGDDLRLSVEDARGIAARYGWTAGAADSLHDAVNGWPLGFSTSVRVLEPNEAPVAHNDLTARMIESLDPQLRELLVRWSVLPAIDEAFCAADGALAYWPQISGIADEALLAVHRSGGAIRFRDSFRELLGAELWSHGHAFVQEAHRRAARAFETSGRALRALRLYAAWQLMDDVLRMCSEQGLALVEMGHVDALQSALEVVERKAVEGNAVALGLMAMEEARAGRQDIAEAWFLQAIAKSPTTAERAVMVHRYVLELVRAGRVDGLKILEPYAQDATLPLDVSASVLSTLATGYVLAGRHEEAQPLIERAVALSERHGDAAVLARVLHHAAWVALFVGTIDNARMLAERAVRVALTCNLFETAARSYTVLYNIAWDVEDDAAKGVEMLDRILDCAMQAGSAPLRLFAMLGLFDAAAETGDVAALQRVQRSLLSYEINYGDPFTNPSLASGHALILAGQGRFFEAHEMLAAAATRPITPDRRALQYAEIALYAAAAGRYTEANNAVATAHEQLTEYKPDRRTANTVAHLALASRLTGEERQAQRFHGILLDLRDGVGPRTRAFIEAVDAILMRSAGATERDVVRRHLVTLHDQRLGGLCAVLTALPLGRDDAETRRLTTSARRIEAALVHEREAIVKRAAASAPAELRRSMLCDLIADETVERVMYWFHKKDEAAIIEWLEALLDRQHNAILAASLFGDTIGECARVLEERNLLDPGTSHALHRLREALDGQVSASQVRRFSEVTNPVDPVDAKIDGLLAKLSERDAITSEHSRCVGAWCARLAKRMHLTRADAQLVTRSGLVHDVGKVLTPPEILKAPRKLLDSEWVIMRRHTLDGVRLLEPVRDLHALIPAVRWHHERYDGKGYPDALPLDDIPFSARIVAVADAFNAMIAPRPYRDALAPMAAIDQLKMASGIQFDPAVVGHMIDVVLRPDR